MFIVLIIGSVDTVLPGLSMMV